MMRDLPTALKLPVTSHARLKMIEETEKQIIKTELVGTIVLIIFKMYLLMRRK